MGQKIVFFYVRYQKWPYFDYLKNIQKMLIFAQFLAEPFIIVSKNNKKKMKKKYAFFGPILVFFSFGWKLAIFSQKMAPIPIIMMLGPFFFFSVFLEEKKKNNLGPPLVALECHKNICNHFPDKLQKSGPNSIQTQNYACKAQVINTIIY